MLKGVVKPVIDESAFAHLQEEYQAVCGVVK